MKLRKLTVNLDQLMQAGQAGERENAPDLTSRGRSLILEHETGLEPATPTLARRSWG